MGIKRQYQSPEHYESKLSRVMERLEVEKYEYDYTRNGGWVEFFYKGKAYRFEQTKDSAAKHGLRMVYGSDCFAQVVLALEDLARIIKTYGLYDLEAWAGNLPALPAATELPECFKVLQFSEKPATVEEVTQRYRELAKVAHPDGGGTSERIGTILWAYREAAQYYSAEGEV